MQPSLNNEFIVYDLTELESEVGKQFNHLQQAVIQNERMSITRDLINLRPDDMTDSGKETYWQREAYLRGQLDILTHILAQSTAATEKTQSESN